MNHWKLMAGTAAAVLLGLAGCSGTPTQKETEEKVAEEGANTVQAGKDDTTDQKTTDSSDKTVTDELSAQNDKIQQGLKDAGFTITDFEQKADEISFDANNKNSSLGIDIEYEKDAKAEYDRLITDDELEKQNEYTKDKKTLCILKNWEDGTYEIAAIDEESSLVYEIDDIQESDLDTVKSVMAAAGFQAE